VVSAIRRKSRGGQLTAVNAANLVAVVVYERIRADAPIDPVFADRRLGSNILERRSAFSTGIQKRAAEAIQMPTAVVGRGVLPEPTTFLRFELPLTEAGRAVCFAEEPDLPYPPPQPLRPLPDRACVDSCREDHGASGSPRGHR
jgi:hypothetical protein